MPLAKFYSLTGNSLMRLNRQKDALLMFYTSLQNAETANDKDGLFKAYNNIKWAHMELVQFEKAIKNFSLCINVMQQLNVADKYATPYNNIASCYVPSELSIQRINMLKEELVLQKYSVNPTRIAIQP